MASIRPAFAAVVFDMDGLLLDTERPVRAAWMSAAAAAGVPLSDADYLGVVGLNHVDSRTRMLRLFGDDRERLAAASIHAEAWLAREFAGRPFEAKPGARRLLRALRSGGLPCAVASSTHRAAVLERLGDAGLLDGFDAVCGGDEVQHGKPAPDLYRLALHRLGADAERSVAFEDSGHGVQSALAAGLAVVAVPDLKAPSPDTLARCLAVLPSLEVACARSVEWFGVACEG